MLLVCSWSRPGRGGGVEVVVQEEHGVRGARASLVGRKGAVKSLGRLASVRKPAKDRGGYEEARGVLPSRAVVEVSCRTHLMPHI